MLFALETVGEHIIAELLTQNRQDVVEKLWTKQAAKYTTSNSKYSPSKLAALYAIELLHNKYEKQAEFITNLINFAQRFSVAVVLVVHPHKIETMRRLT